MEESVKGLLFDRIFCRQWHSNEDHVHRATKPVDPSSLPPRIKPNLTRLFIESCPCGANRMVEDNGTPATPWFLSALFQNQPEGTETPDL